MIPGRRAPLATFMLVTAALILGALRLWAPGAIAREDGATDLVLVVRGMAFRDAAARAANPTLRLRAGSRIRLVVRNEETGVNHNFAIPAWRVDSGSIPGPGERLVEFSVPERNGREAYQCTPHAAMMRGEIVVE